MIALKVRSRMKPQELEVGEDITLLAGIAKESEAARRFLPRSGLLRDGMLVHFRKNLCPITLPEIEDFNAFWDRKFKLYSEKCINAGNGACR